MKTIFQTNVTPLSDIELIDRSLRGQREAYGVIVERYQNLICSMAYSACGNVARSEDLAQETFITAWKQLATLREPVKFKSWLCGIARNLINNSLRRETRDAMKFAQPLDTVADTESSSATATSSSTSPADHAISHEEETLVWNALAQVPETYREPLVLYYREGQSIMKVAEAMDLSEDAVKQRLSRGRQLLKEQVSSMVETTLGASVPKKAFALAVLAALPAFAPSAAAATLATTAKGTAAVQSAAFLTWMAALLGPVIGIFGGYLGVRASIENTKSPREREYMKRFSIGTMVLVLVFCLAFFALGIFGRSWARNHPVSFAATAGGITVAYCIAIVVLSLRGNRRQAQIQMEDGTHWTQQNPAQANLGFEYRSKVEFLGLPLIHVASRASREHPLRMPCATGWIAVGARARGVLLGMGGIASGFIAVGGVAIGVISFSGFALGILAVGGVSIGAWSVGGFALGWQAVGGMAMAWEAAYGGFAVAHHLAVGGVTLGAHANDQLAKDYAATSLFVNYALNFGRQSQWLVLLAVAPVILAWRKLNAARNQRQGAVTP